MTTIPEWVLLGTTVVHREDIRRIEVSTQFGLIYNVILTHGPPLRIVEGQPGAEWLFSILKAAELAVRMNTTGVVEESSDSD